jgi:hypothetical protein
MPKTESRVPQLLTLGVLTLFLVVLVWSATDVMNPRGVGATAAQTATAAAAAAYTAGVTTPHAARRADDVRRLNQHSAPGGPNVGDLLLALWDGRQTGGTPSIATPGPVFDASALTAMVHGIYLSKAITSAVPFTGCTGTTTTTYRKCVLCTDSAGTFTMRPGASATSAATAVKPDCRDYETEVLVAAIPVSFTPAASVPSPNWFSQATPRADGVKF